VVKEEREERELLVEADVLDVDVDAEVPRLLPVATRRTKVDSSERVHLRTSTTRFTASSKPNNAPPPPLSLHTTAAYPPSLPRSIVEPLHQSNSSFI